MDSMVGFASTGVSFMLRCFYGVMPCSLCTRKVWRLWDWDKSATTLILFASICWPTNQLLYIKAYLAEPLLPAKPAREATLGFARLLLHRSIELVHALHQLFACLVFVFLGLGLCLRELGLCVSSL